MGILRFIINLIIILVFNVSQIGEVRVLIHLNVLNRTLKLMFWGVRNDIYFLFDSFIWKILLSLNVFVTVDRLWFFIVSLISTNKNFTELIFLCNRIQMKNFLSWFVNIGDKINYVRIVWFGMSLWSLIDAWSQWIGLGIIYMLSAKIMGSIMVMKVDTIQILWTLDLLWSSLIKHDISIWIMFGVTLCSFYRLNVSSIFKVSNN